MPTARLADSFAVPSKKALGPTRPCTFIAVTFGSFIAFCWLFNTAPEVTTEIFQLGLIDTTVVHL